MRLLIIDDSVLINQKLRELLSDIKGLKIVGEALDGLDGIDKYWKFKPDIVILDIKLPKFNGIEVLQNIRRVKSPTKVIVLTNHSNQYFREACLTEGADFYLDKSTEFQKVYDICNEYSINNSFNSQAGTTNNNWNGNTLDV